MIFLQGSDSVNFQFDKVWCYREEKHTRKTYAKLYSLSHHLGMQENDYLE